MSPEAEAILDDLLLCAKLRGGSRPLIWTSRSSEPSYGELVLDNPDGPAAADRIEAMDREITALRADVTRLTASLAAAEAGWQPIETAPNDEAILVARDDGSVEIVPADDNDYIWKPYSGPHGAGITAPTHWQRPPAPPALSDPAS